MIKIVVGFVCFFMYQCVYAAQDIFPAKVLSVQVDYRGWYRISVSASNTQGCNSPMLIIYRNAPDPVKAAMLSTILAAKVAGSDVEFTVNTCDPSTADAILWTATMK